MTGSLLATLVPKRYEQELTHLKKHYPEFNIEERLSPVPHHVVTGRLQPFDEHSEAELVVANMRARHTIDAYGDGWLAPTVTDIRPAKLVINPMMYQAYDIEIFILANGWAPRIYIVSPVIDDRSQKGLVHLNRTFNPIDARAHPGYREDNRMPRCDACVVATQDLAWTWLTHHLADLVGYVAVWLGAFASWKHGQIGSWPLEEAPHSVKKWLRETPEDAPCVCGAPATYGQHCRKSHIKALPKR